MTLSKRSLFALTVLSSAILAGCQSQSNQISFSTPAPTATFNTQNQTAMVNVMTQDLRPSAEVSSYTAAGQVQRLTAVPEVRQMFQQAMQQNLNSKGFTIVEGAGNANVLVNVRKFYADVQEGNLRYKVDANISIEVQVQGSRGKFNKNFNANRAYEGAFGADNQKIRNVLGQAYTDVIQSIYNDNEISNAIHQYK